MWHLVLMGSPPLLGPAGWNGAGWEYKQGHFRDVNCQLRPVSHCGSVSARPAKCAHTLLNLVATEGIRTAQRQDHRTSLFPELGTGYVIRGNPRTTIQTLFYWDQVPLGLQGLF